MSNLLEVRSLSKQYPGVRAVDDISFAVGRGRCFGLLGPNGAGKTTTLEILEGITEADEGEVLYDGHPRDHSYREVIGIQFQHTALQDFQTVGETLRLFARFYERNQSIEELIELCHLGDLLERDTRQLSGGQRQRLLLAIALVNDPELIFLDEPTTGLDPQSRRNFWALVERIKDEGKTVLMTTHYMEEAGVLCDELAIIDHGRIIEQGSPQQLIGQHFPRALVRLPVSSLVDPATLPGEFEIRGDFAIAATDDIEAVLEHVRANGVPWQDIHIGTPTLDDLFLKLTGHGLRER